MRTRRKVLAAAGVMSIGTLLFATSFPLIGEKIPICGWNGAAPDYLPPSTVSITYYLAGFGGEFSQQGPAFHVNSTGAVGGFWVLEGGVGYQWATHSICWSPVFVTH